MLARVESIRSVHESGFQDIAVLAFWARFFFPFTQQGLWRTNLRWLVWTGDEGFCQRVALGVSLAVCARPQRDVIWDRGDNVRRGE